MSHEKLKEILIRRLKLKDPQFRLEGRGRISGSLVSPTFAGKRAHQRQQMIWDALDAELGATSGKEVGMLLAYAPDEWDLPLEGTIAAAAARGTVRQARPKARRKAG
jgi:acid stress-induced BolA-like protein IbaG/YrbA